MSFLLLPWFSKEPTMMPKMIPTPTFETVFWDKKEEAPGLSDDSSGHQQCLPYSASEIKNALRSYIGKAAGQQRNSVMKFSKTKTE